MKPAIARDKRTTRNHEMHHETKRTRSHHSTEAKFIFAALFLKAEARGVSQKEFLSDMKAIGYSVANQTFSDWVRDMKSRGRVGVVNRKISKPKALSDEQRRIMIGWVLYGNQKHQIVHLADYVREVKEKFEISITTATASNYLAEDGFTQRLTQSKTQGFQFDRQKLSGILWRWVERKRDNGFLDTSRYLLCSIDFTFTGHRTDRTQLSHQQSRRNRVSDQASRAPQIAV